MLVIVVNNKKKKIIKKNEEEEEEKKMKKDTISVILKFFRAPDHDQVKATLSRTHMNLRSGPWPK